MSFPITGTFIDDITYDIPSSNWTNGQWSNELDCMKAVDIDTLIFIRGGFGRKTVFPSEVIDTPRTPDFAGYILEEAEKRKMKVYMGLYISNIDWNHGDAETEIKINQKFAREIYSRYGKMDSFAGWYLPHETSRNELNISEVMHGLSSICKDIAPDKSVLISPYFQTEIISADDIITPDRHYEEWDEILSKSKGNIDICAFQDGTSPIDKMDAYYGAVRKCCDKYNMQLWVNTETFERDVRCLYPPISFGELEEKLYHHQKYAEKIITFEFSHFLSPQSIYPSARNLYKRYVDYYGKK